MALVGIQALSYKEFIMQNFYVFSKDKSLELQYQQEQDKQQLRASHIISINYLDLAQAYATHEFQVQSKFFFFKSILTKTQENSRLKTRYLKGITIEQLFIISILRDHREFLLFYSALKNQKINFVHTIYFVFIFLRSHITNVHLI